MIRCAALALLGVIWAADVSAQSVDLLTSVKTRRDACKLGQGAIYKIVESKTICFVGQISKESARQFLSLDLDGETWIVVDSGGGDAEAALEIGEAVLNAHATVVIDHLCFSACANCVFLAGRQKFVLPESLVGWHGGPFHVPAPNVRPEFHAHVRKLARRSDAFLRKSTSART